MVKGWNLDSAEILPPLELPWCFDCVITLCILFQEPIHHLWNFQRLCLHSNQIIAHQFEEKVLQISTAKYV